MHKHGGDIYSHPNFIDFSANINLLGTPLAVLQAAKSAMDEIGHYPQAGYERLRQAVSKLEQTEPEQIVCGNGAAEVIFSLVLAKKPKRAMVFEPAFWEYEQALKSVDCEIVYEYLYPEEGFQIREVPARLDDTIDMVFLCNPNNPTGVLSDIAILGKLLERCEQTGTLLVADECFLEFMTGEGHSMKPFLESSQSLFIVKAFTKIFGIPGLRLGYGLCKNQDIRKRMQAVTQPWNVSVPAQEAGIAAAEETEFIEKTRQETAVEKQFLLEQLSVFGQGEAETLPEKFFIKIYGHAANFIFFKSILGLDQELMKYNILIRNCSNFRGLSEGWYRIAVRTREENEKLLESLRQVAKERSLKDEI